MILLDTHVLIWLDEGNEQLGTESLALINEAYHKYELIVAAITFWEVAMLVSKSRIELSMDGLEWRSDLLKSGMLEIPTDGHIGILAAQLDDFHGDPADRLIMATAIKQQATLITADKKILQWRGPVPCLDARR